MTRNMPRNGNSKRRAMTRKGPAILRTVHTPPIVRYSPDVFGFPDRIMTKLRYCDVVGITSLAGAQGKYIWRWNSTYDPDFTGTGHQPLYRDTYATVYNQYAVVSAQATIEILNPTVSPLVVILSSDDDGSLSTNNNTLEEQSHGQSKLMTPLTGSASKTVFTANWDAASFFNIDPLTSQTYKTPVGSNPSEESMIALSVFTTDLSTAAVTVKITLVQSVLWTELTTPTGS